MLSSASYLFTDYLKSSEGIQCYQLVQNLEEVCFNVIAANIRVRNKLPNAQLFEAGSLGLMLPPWPSPPRLVVDEVYYTLSSYRIGRRILKNSKVDIIHHMKPMASGGTFSLVGLSRDFAEIPFVVGPIANYPEESRTRTDTVVLKMAGLLHDLTIRRADLILAVNERTRKSYESWADGDVRTIPQGIDVDKYRPMAEPKATNVVLYVGDLDAQKGVHHLIEAMPNLVREFGAILKLIGNGSLEGKLRRRVEQLGIAKSVLFMGRMASDDLIPHLQGATVLCFPTHGEAFGRVILEAMACGTPVVASDLPEQAEIISSEGGLLFEPRNAVMLGRAIARFLSDDALRMRMSKSARARVVENYSLPIVMDKYRDAYLKLIQ